MTITSFVLLYKQPSQLVHELLPQDRPHRSSHIASQTQTDLHHAIQRSQEYVMQEERSQDLLSIVLLCRLPRFSIPT